MRDLRRVLLFGVLATTLACGGGDDPAAPSAGPLEGVTLAVSSVTSLDVVRVAGLPPARTTGGFEVQVVTDGDADARLPLEHDSEGAYFWAPLHPSTPNAGGPITVRITDGTHTSPDLPLEIGALPEAPGAFAELVAALRAHVEQRAAWSGTSLADLKQLAFDETPAGLLPLKVAQSYVDTDSPTDLTQLVANDGGVLTDGERELLDRMFGRVDFTGLVQADVDWFDQNDPSNGLLPSPGGPLARRNCIDHGPEISTAAQLSEAMTTQAQANVAIDADGAPGRTLRALGVMLGAGSLIPGYGTAFSVAGVGVAVWTASRNLTAGLYPSELTSLEFELDRSEFEEDDTDFGTWSDVEVVAASSGWKVDQDLSNVMISTFGAVLSGAQVTQLAEAEFLLYAEIAALNEGLGQHLEESGGVIEYCAKTWDVDITNLPFSTAQAMDRGFEVDPAARRIRPLEVGPDVLRVAAQSSMFGGAEVHLDLPISCEPILIDLVPDEVELREPGEPVVLLVTIDNAEDDSILWDSGSGSWDDGLGADTNDVDTRTLNTPTDPDAYPFVVYVEATSRSGLRADGMPLRRDTSTIRLARAAIEIEPPFECISPGETFQFTANVTGIEDYTVDWDVIEGYGSIGSNGLYQSLSQGTSHAVIRASLVGIEGVEDTARIEVSNCTCHYTVSIAGATTFESGGADIAYKAVDYGQGPIYQFFVQTEDLDQVLIGISLVPTEERASPTPGDTGTWPVNFSFGDGGRSWTAALDREESGVALTITELTETTMSGSLEGIAVAYDEDGNVQSEIVVFMEFRAGEWIGGWPCE